jgi:hypothetical protein
MSAQRLKTRWVDNPCVTDNVTAAAALVAAGFAVVHIKPSRRNPTHVAFFFESAARDYLLKYYAARDELQRDVAYATRGAERQR